MHFALSANTWRRASRYSNFCNGDPITIVQILLIHCAPGGAAAVRQRLQLERPDPLALAALEIQLELLDQAEERDDFAAHVVIDSVPQPISWEDYRALPSEGEFFAALEGSATAAEESPEDPQKLLIKCDICKTRFQNQSMFVANSFYFAGPFINFMWIRPICSLNTHFKSRKHLNKAKKHLSAVSSDSTRAMERSGLTMTGFVKTRQLSNSLLVSSMPNDILLQISRTLSPDDLRSLCFTCQFFQRLLLRRSAWSKIDFRKFQGFLDETTIRRVARSGFPAAQELVTWTEGGNISKSMKTTYAQLIDDRFAAPEGHNLLSFRSIFICPAPQTLYAIPTLCTQLRKLKVRFSEVGPLWVEKVLRNNTNLRKLELRFGLYRPIEDSTSTH